MVMKSSAGQVLDGLPRLAEIGGDLEFSCAHTRAEVAPSTSRGVARVEAGPSA